MSLLNNVQVVTPNMTTYTELLTRTFSSVKEWKMLGVYRQFQLLRLSLGELTLMSQHFFEFEIIELRNAFKFLMN